MCLVVGSCDTCVVCGSSRVLMDDGGVMEGWIEPAKLRANERARDRGEREREREREKQEISEIRKKLSCHQPSRIKCCCCGDSESTSQHVWSDS